MCFSRQNIFADCPIKLSPIKAVTTTAPSAPATRPSPSAAGPSSAPGPSSTGSSGDDLGASVSGSAAATADPAATADSAASADSAAAAASPSASGVPATNSTPPDSTIAGTNPTDGGLDMIQAGDNTKGKTGMSKMKGAAKPFEVGVAVTLRYVQNAHFNSRLTLPPHRNIIGRAWIQDNKNGTNAEFHAYMKNMSKEDEKVCSPCSLYPPLTRYPFRNSKKSSKRQ